MAVRADRVKEVISRNTSFAFGRQFLTGLVFLLITPYVISRLGVERYGVWALTSAMLGYAALADLGVRTSFTKFVAQHYALGHRDYILQVVGNGIVFYSLLSMIPAILVAALRRPVLLAFNVSGDLLLEAEPLLLLMTLVFFLVNVSNVFCGVIEGVQRMEVSNCIFVGHSALLGLGIVTALAAGSGLVGMGITAAVAAAAAAAAMFVAAQRVTGLGFWPWRLRVSWPVFKELVSYGVKLQGSAVAVVGNLHLDKFLLARFWGLELVAVYEIALRIALILRQVPTMLFSAIVPAVSDLEARGERFLLERLYEKGLRYVAAAGIPLAAFALLSAGDLIQAWIGSPAFARAGGVLKLLAFAHCTAILIDAPFATARGLGRLRYELTTGIAHPFAHLGLGLLLVPSLGLWGAGLAHASVVASVAVGAALWMHRGLGLSREGFVPFYSRVLKGPVCAALVAVACALPIHVLLAGSSLAASGLTVGGLTGPGGTGGRLGSIVALAASGSVFAAAYVISALRTGVVDCRDLAGVPVVGRLLSSRLGRLAAGGRAEELPCGLVETSPAGARHGEEGREVAV